MKILYITNQINGSGGLERVLSVKASALVSNYNYEVHILTLNDGLGNPFYRFNSKIKFYNIKVGGNPISYLLKYRNGIKSVIKVVNPDIISVCDDGLKGMLFPIFFGKKIPVIYERHVSKQIEIKREGHSIFRKIKSNLLFRLMNYGGSRFDKFVVLTKGNIKEWKLNNIEVIPNPLPFYPNEKSNLKNKKVLVVGKQSYQKGYDRLLKIWEIVHKKYPDWNLEIVGKYNPKFKFENTTEYLGLNGVVKFLPPDKNIQKKYMEASIYLMTSRFEGFGMVLIEAMSFGVPCIAFDCPHGPADIIKDGEDGFLVANGAIDTFATKLMDLMESKALRLQFGTKALQHVNRFNVNEVVKKWDDLFQSLVHLK